jgi:hypothetical protein
MLFNKNTISSSDKFIPDNYPQVISELKIMNEQIRHVPIYYKENIVISYFKDHSINRVWANSNEQLTMMVTSGIISSLHIESLFESCRQNKIFLHDLEAYIKKELYEKSSN